MSIFRAILGYSGCGIRIGKPPSRLQIDFFPSSSAQSLHLNDTPPGALSLFLRHLSFDGRCQWQVSGLARAARARGKVPGGHRIGRGEDARGAHQLLDRSTAMRSGTRLPLRRGFRPSACGRKDVGLTNATRQVCVRWVEEDWNENMGAICWERYEPG